MCLAPNSKQYPINIVERKFVRMFGRSVSDKLIDMRDIIRKL